MLGISNQRIKQLAISYPLEILVSFIFACIFFKNGVSIESWQTYYPLRPIFFPIYFSLIYLFHPFKRLYPISWLLPLGLTLVTMYLGDDRLVEYLFGILAICFLLFITNNFEKNNKLFLQITLRNLKHFIFAGLITGVVVAAYMILIFATIVLFGIEIVDSLSEGMPLFLLCMLYPLLYIHFNQRKDEKPFRDYNLTELYYLLTIVLIIYTVIIYFYLINIFIALELPNGRVSSVMLPYIGLALLCTALNIFNKNHKLQWFQRYLPFVSILPLILLWWGIVHRVGDYGLTENRIYLIAFCLLLTLFSLFLLIKPLFQYRIYTLLSVGMLALVCIVLSPQKIAIENQYARFVNKAIELGVFDNNKQINAEYLKDYNLIENNQEIKNNLVVLDKYSNVVSFDKFINEYGKENANKLLDNFNKVNEKYDSYNDIYFFKSSDDNKVNIKNYSKFIYMNDAGLNLSSKTEQCQCKIDSVVVNDEEKQINVHINTKDLDNYLIQAGINLTQKKWSSIYSEGDSQIFSVPTEEGGVLLFSKINYHWVEFNTFKGYVFEYGSIIAYLEP